MKLPISSTITHTLRSSECPPVDWWRSRAAGHPSGLWTTRRIAPLIEREFGVAYHPAHVSRILADCGWSWQKPARRAIERDEAAIAHWKRYRWVEITYATVNKASFRGHPWFLFSDRGRYAPNHSDNGRCDEIAAESVLRWSVSAASSPRVRRLRNPVDRLCRQRNAI